MGLAGSTMLSLELEVRSVPLAAERHGIIVPWVALDSALHPDHAAYASICLQCGNSCRVRSDEVSEERIVPVKNDYSILAEVHRRQVCWHKLSVSMPVRSDGILKDRRSPRIMRIEYGEVIRVRLADGKGILNSVAGDQGKVVWTETSRGPGPSRSANRNPAGRSPRIGKSP